MNEQLTQAQETKTTEIKSKTCAKCAEEKPVTEFTKHKGYKDGLEAKCKTCRSVYRTTGKGKALQALHNTQRRRQNAETELGEQLLDTLTTEEVEDLQNEPECAYCQTQLTEENPVTLDHVIPFKHGGANEYENLVACCRSCNARKRDGFFFEFLRDNFDRQAELRFLLLLIERYNVDLSDLVNAETITQAAEATNEEPTEEEEPSNGFEWKRLQLSSARA
ncbi:HNH endonuclease [Gracilibacillus timonensis]|uniref:HNH endonuclease n=1 Tax=Gracilibacillus timonensis TaxID=1816696 RepID=UPI0008267E73|nr:HNH endonuclease signature motif containing protein [Gracilibacillus timonensis]